MRTYGYSYDALNRLKQARYGEGTAYTANLDKYKMSVSSYDLNGNIEFLDRYLNGNLMDKLEYTYSGNQLLAVKDDGLKNQGFVEPTAQEAMEYDYDLNGNLKLDKNKGLTGVEYNHLNLPKKVLAGSDYISYIYDASGAKLAKKVNTNTTEDVHYRGSFVYKGSSLDYVIHDEGLIDYDGGSYSYQYYLKDHLGNTRTVFKNNGGTAQVEQEQHYYPYGMAIDGLKYTGSTANKYLYNGKELQDDQLGSHKLDWLDYGARMYDAQIGRWHCVDPMAETYLNLSPYNYVANNPLKFIDPNGMYIDDYFNQNGDYLGTDNAITDNVKVTTDAAWEANKTVDESGNETIDHEVGKSISVDHSKSNITESASLSIYDHYNTTGLNLVAHGNENGNGGLTFSYKSSGARIKVKLEGNKSTGIADHASEIENSFIHEKQHSDDYNKLGYSAYKNMSKDQKEQRAVGKQMKHSSFKKTRVREFQVKVKKYGRNHGMVFPLKSIIAPVNL